MSLSPWKVAAMILQPIFVQSACPPCLITLVEEVAILEEVASKGGTDFRHALSGSSTIYEDGALSSQGSIMDHVRI